MKYVRRDLYVATGFALGMILAYVLSFLIPTESVKAIEWKFAIMIPVFCLLGGYLGARVFQSGYRLKTWQQLLVTIILLGALYYGLWFLHELRGLAEALKVF